MTYFASLPGDDKVEIMRPAVIAAAPAGWNVAQQVHVLLGQLCRRQLLHQPLQLPSRVVVLQ